MTGKTALSEVGVMLDRLAFEHGRMEAALRAIVACPGDAAGVYYMASAGLGLEGFDTPGDFEMARRLLELDGDRPGGADGA